VTPTTSPKNHGPIRQPSLRGLPDAQRLPGVLSRYRDPNLARSLTEIAVTFAPFAALWAAMWALMHVSYWLTLALALPAAGFLVRLFMIQHDCGHGAFFRTRAINDWVGRLFGVFTLTPYDYWKRTHAAHHAAAGNLDRRGLGDIETLTVSEYLNLGWRKRFAYRLYRHPLVMFGIGPTYLFLLQHHAPLGLMCGAGWKPWVSAMSTNAGIASVVAVLMWLIGPGAFLMIHGPIFMLAATIGVWLFYVQHQFEDTRWAHEANWNFPQAALHGSSHYDLPIILRWFSANIGVHHVHHLASRIPFYRLREALRDYPELTNVGRLTLWQSLRCVNYSLWDEDAQRLISFRTLGRQLRAGDARA
jgi:acyl-lipid omega-6 desaturase (Delta-12 desaturase)